MASLSLYRQFETNLMSNRKFIELLLQLKSAKAHGKNKSNHTWSSMFCVIFYNEHDAVHHLDKLASPYAALRLLSEVM